MSTWLGHGTPRHSVRHYSGVFVKAFLNEMNIWIGKMSKADCPPNWMRWASSSKLKIWIKWKGWVRGTSCPPGRWAETLVFSCLDLELTPAALLDPTWRLCLRLHDHASQLPIFSLFVYVCLLWVLFLWRTLIQSPFLQVENWSKIQAVHREEQCCSWQFGTSLLPIEIFKNQPQKQVIWTQLGYSVSFL